MTHTEIVKKLVGEIKPIGESNTDERRLENLKMMCDIVYELVAEIWEVARKNNQEYSIMEAQKYAKKFLTTDLGINQ